MIETIGSTGELPPGRGEHILYLDDEAPLVFLITRMLKQLGYAPDGFSKASDALAAFRSDPKKFALVVTDLSMPGTSGIEFASQVLAEFPGAAVVIVSGAIDPADVTRATSIGVRRVMQKPTTVEELGQAVARVLCDMTVAG